MAIYISKVVLSKVRQWNVTNTKEEYKKITVTIKRIYIRQLAMRFVSGHAAIQRNYRFVWLVNKPNYLITRRTFT